MARLLPYHLHGNEELIVQVKVDPQQAAISDKLKARLVIAGKTAEGGKRVTAEDVGRARHHGATDFEIHDTVLIAAAFCMFNRYVDGLATWAPDDADFYRARGSRSRARIRLRDTAGKREMTLLMGDIQLRPVRWSGVMAALTLMSVLSVLVTRDARAQDPTGTIEGAVSDRTTAAIRRAPVSAVNLDPGLPKETETAAGGFYRILLLPVGKHGVTVHASGF